MLKRLPQFFYEWIGFTTVDNLLFLPVKLKFHIRHTGTHTQVHLQNFHTLSDGTYRVGAGCVTEACTCSVPIEDCKGRWLSS